MSESLLQAAQELQGEQEAQEPGGICTLLGWLQVWAVFPSQAPSLALSQPLCVLGEGSGLSPRFAETRLWLSVSQTFTFHLHQDQHG